MFAQLFLGIFFIIKGIVEHIARKPNLFIPEAAVQNIPKEELSNYLKKVGKVHILLGAFIASMGQIEFWYKPELWIYITTYIVLGFGLIGILLYLNKRYSGSYIMRG
ncbi:hypothetical protein [Ornithinibacillus halotolerans]|uniref:DUF3784 domain-containing protein n=1 Tax=Ornithinibacillus halotolerans TaxID=1274357 RepID=A0A916W1G8_9BACI|nr:hypothetical protein [Ornithinibacillus halotolerans]GGA60025.1 hypothetical protein GCM10008025_00060 [Ornithinibacillus halotolerans]